MPTKSNNDSDILSTLVQAFSALSIFVFYFGWVWEDSYLQMFGLRVSSFDFPFYYFLIQGLKVNFPNSIENPVTRWQIWAWAISLTLVGLTLVGNQSKRFKAYFTSHPLATLIGVTVILVGLFVSVHVVGTIAGQERGRILRFPDNYLGSVAYEYISEPRVKPKKSQGYLLLVTKDALYVPYEEEIRMSPDSQKSKPQDLTIVPLDRLSFARLNTRSP